MDEITCLVRPAILAMTPYSSARTEGKQTDVRIHLDANENPYPPYPGTPDLIGLNRYPEGQPSHLLDQFADYLLFRASRYCSRGARTRRLTCYFEDSAPRAPMR